MLHFRLEDDAEYSALKQRRTELLVERDELERRINSLLTTSDDEDRERRKQAQLEAVISNKEAPSGDMPPNRSDEYNKARARQRLLVEALRETDRHIGQARSRISKQICGACRNEFMNDVREFYLSLIDTAVKAYKIEQWRRSFYDSDVQWTAFLPSPSSFRYSNDPTDHDSHFCRVMREACEQGFITPSDLPKEFISAWEKKGVKLFKKSTADVVKGLAEKTLTSILPSKKSRDEEAENGEWKAGV